MRVDLIQIGDYFAYPTQTIHDGNLKIGRVNFIRHDGIVQVDFVDTNAQLLEPIEITPSILENNGFTRYGQIYANLQQWVGKFGDKRKSLVQDIRTNECGMNDVWIKYVHELQHALKLCKIDKEIVL